MSLFFIKKLLTSKSAALWCLKRNVEKFRTFPAFQETKAVNNKFKTACE